MLKFVLILLCIVLGLVFILFVAIYVWQDKLIFFPEKIPVTYKFNFKQPFTEVYLNTPDKAKLHALHFKLPQPKGVILYFHGNAGSLRTWGYLAEDLLIYGYDVFMPDYRGFGKSTGKISQQALYTDAQLAYDYLQQQYPETQIIIFGRSIGTGVATKLAATTTPKLLLLETPFNKFADLARAHYSFLPASLLLKYTFRSDKWIQQVPCPVYILHGTADVVVPYASGAQLARAVKNPGSFITIKEGGHNNLSSFSEYNQALQQILK